MLRNSCRKRNLTLLFLLRHVKRISRAILSSSYSYATSKIWELQQDTTLLSYSVTAPQQPITILYVSPWYIISHGNQDVLLLWYLLISQTRNFLIKQSCYWNMTYYFGYLLVGWLFSCFICEQKFLFFKPLSFAVLMSPLTIEQKFFLT